MDLLITGANGFIGKNLRATLAQSAHRLWLIDVNSTEGELRAAASAADFVFHLAGVNRPQNEAEFETGNAGFTETLVALLETGKKPPVLLSGSTQALLDNPYGRSKLKAEAVLRAYAQRTGSPVYLYRLTNAFGKWSRPNYNSAVATFCYNIARDLPVQVADPARTVRLVYIDDVVAEFLRALDGAPTVGEGGFCVAQPEQEVTLGELVRLLQTFKGSRVSLQLPDQSDPFVRKLYATYQSFLPEDGFAYRPVCHTDERGAFTELLRMGGHGQVSVNVARPGICKGEHWHHSKHEKFIVVSGRGVIRLRDPFSDTVLRYDVQADPPTVVDIPPGYTHNIENLGDGDLVTLMWASETFDPQRPDTYRLPVEPQGRELL